MDSISLSDVRAYALARAADLGWNVSPTDCTVNGLPNADWYQTGQYTRWHVGITIRPALNTHRALTGLESFSGPVWRQGQNWHDDLSESQNANQGRLYADDEV